MNYFLLGKWVIKYEKCRENLLVSSVLANYYLHVHFPLNVSLLRWAYIPHLQDGSRPTFSYISLSSFTYTGAPYRFSVSSLPFLSCRGTTIYQRIVLKILSEERVSILFFTIYTTYRYTKINNFFRYISCSIQASIFVFSKVWNHKDLYTHIIQRILALTSNNLDTNWFFAYRSLIRDRKVSTRFP